MKILFKLTTRSRPQKAIECITNIQKLCNNSNYHILVTADEDDNTMSGFINLIEWIDKLTVIYGESKNKMDAVNRDIANINSWDILVSTSDDMKFITQGFDDIIRQDFRNNLDKLIHYNDGNQQGNVCTLPIMGKDYYNKFGYIYHPSYKSVWSDVEQTEVAHLLGKYKYMGDEKILFRHMHPSYGLSQYDEQYRKTEDLNVWGEDQKNIIIRKKNNYYLTPELIINSPKYPESSVQQWITDYNNARKNAGYDPIDFNTNNP